MHTNPVTGEVTFELAGKTYTLHATMKRVAELNARLQVPGLEMVAMMVKCRDARAIYWGLVCLCSSGNAVDFDNLLLTPHMGDAGLAISAALEAGLPEAPKDGEVQNPLGTAAIN